MFAAKIGIVGIGFVGDAVLQSFQQQGLKIAIYDKYKKLGALDDSITTCDILFLCLPTQYDTEKERYDISAITEICQFLRDSSFKNTVVIKSTVEPGTCESLSQSYSLSIIHNPEFLTARTAKEDFHNQKHVVLGETQKSKRSQLHLERLLALYNAFYPLARISVCESKESETMKIFVNSFYAIKVEIFTEFYLLCQQQGINYNQVQELMLLNGWINPMHTQVPGPDGKISYGGACFPKDTRALLSCMQRSGTPNKVLKACIDERDELRKE